MGYNPWGRKESDTTERLNTAIRFPHISVCALHVISRRLHTKLFTVVSSGQSRERGEDRPPRPGLLIIVQFSSHNYVL